MVNHSPSTAAIGWTLLHLAKDAKLAKKVSKEFGKAGSKILNTCLIESSRLYAPMQITRSITKEIEIQGFKFYPGMTTFIAPALSSLDGKV
jgi:cytochrome P450